MAGYLNFDPNRKLGFEPGRPLDFETGRPLDFQPARDLDFQPNRDLGFGHRGVVFRGYVCPICGALVASDATGCNECGAVFEGPPSPPPTPPPPPNRAPASRAPTPSPKKPASADAPPVAYCAYCGVRLHKGDAFCWNCGAVTKRGSEVVKLPARNTESVTRDWRNPEER